MSRFHELRVSGIAKLTPNAVAITFQIPEDLRDQFEFVAGQYITIRHTLDGEELRRAYSISSATGANSITIGVKKVPGGQFSVYANDVLREGDILEIMPPEGRFVFEPGQKAVNVVAFAAGSGITPIMSIAQEVLNANQENKLVLVYGNQNKEETMFLDEIRELSEKYTDRFFVYYLFSRAREENSLFGRIDTSTVNFITRNKFKEMDFHAAYICGPEQMIDLVHETLIAGGMDRERIHTELFTTPISDSAPIEHQNGLTEVTVTLDDEVFTFQMNKEAILLDAILDEDIDAPYSCQGGVCSTCIAKVTEGQVVMDQNQILTDSEMEEGLILTCQSHPTTGTLKIDYDDV